MFKWIKNRISKRINKEMDGCIIQNLNFVNMVETEEFVFNRNIDHDILNRIYEIKEKTIEYDKTKLPGNNFKPNETDELLEMNMHCRNIWTNYFKKNAFDFDKVFSSDDLDNEN